MTGSTAVSAAELAVDVFAGPGGWSEAARALGITEVGIELDAAACATRAAAGHRTIRADAAAFPLDRLAGRVSAFVGSPPCKLYSAAGPGIGRLVLDVLAAAIPRMLAGDDCRAEVREQVYPVAHEYRQAENEARSEAKRWSAGRVAKAARSDAFEASLVLEPARYIAGIGPGLQWVALEQVPAVLPLWEVYARELRKAGFSAWCGKLNSADYGVAQTRERAILIASRSRRVTRPEPTHYDPRKGMQLWGTPWVSMAEALGWGATGRPSVAVTAGGTSTGGAEPFGHRGRDALGAEQDAGRWALRMDAQRNATSRPATAPAPALKFGHSSAECQWVLHTNRDQRPDGSRQTVDPSTAPAPALTSKSGGQWVMRGQVGASLAETRRDHELNEPAPTITSGGSAAGSGNGAGLVWAFRNNNNNNACTRSLDEPAGTLFFGGWSNWAARVAENPAAASPDGAPGNGERSGQPPHAQDSVRITVQEAAVLQSFPVDYPWQGTKTAKFTQVGNAVPPLLAEHVLAMATGLRRQARVPDVGAA